jgi:hypothetical protein
MAGSIPGSARTAAASATAFDMAGVTTAPASATASTGRDRTGAPPPAAGERHHLDAARALTAAHVRPAASPFVNPDSALSPPFGFNANIRIEN